MAISGVGAGGGQVYLPPPASAADGLGGQFRAQLCAQLQQAMATDLFGAPPLQPAAHPATSTYGSTIMAMPPLRSTSSSSSAPVALTTGQWADLAHSVGAQYLPGQLADVFTRQMALESGNFAPDVIYGRRVSSAGAQGIAQLMPASYPNVDRLNPVASLHAAAQTMRDNLQQFGGDTRKALAAYDAGAGTVSSLVQRLGPNWESGLPDETRQYLADILG